jgi:hypothetical protein
MKVGFTGTRKGMTDAQKDAVEKLMEGSYLTSGDWEFHHGDCVGADADAHDIARGCGAYIVVHPGPNDSQRAGCKADEECRRGVSFFARNRDIVNDTDLIIATPRLMQLEEQGGTSYTVRYARKVGKTVYIVWPDGSVTR